MVGAVYILPDSEHTISYDIIHYMQGFLIIEFKMESQHQISIIDFAYYTCQNIACSKKPFIVILKSCTCYDIVVTIEKHTHLLFKTYRTCMQIDI